MNKPPTLMDVARAAGVSRSTAARALSGSGYVESKKKKRIESTAAELGYRGSAIARALRTNRSGTIGILIADITNPIFPRIVKGADNVLTARGTTLFLCNTEGDHQRQATFIKQMQERLTDGFIFVSQSLSEEVCGLLKNRAPALFINRRPESFEADYVGPDNARGVGLLVEHLTGLGHRKIAYLKGPMSSSTAQERFAVFCHEMKTRRLEIPGAFIVDSDYSVAAGIQAAEQLLTLPVAQRPTAILAANDFAALGLIGRAQEMGIEVPRELSVTGFDNAYGDAVWRHAFPDSPHIVTVEQSRRLLGETAAKLLLRRIENPDISVQTEIVPVALVGGTTTAPPVGR